MPCLVLWAVNGNIFCPCIDSMFVKRTCPEFALDTGFGRENGRPLSSSGTLDRHVYAGIGSLLVEET